MRVAHSVFTFSRWLGVAERVAQELLDFLDGAEREHPRRDAGHLAGAAFPATTRRAIGSAPGVMLNSVRPQPIEQPQQQRIRRHLAADRHRNAAAHGAAPHLPQQAQHRRVQRLVAIGHALVGAIDRQRVLDEIVGADGEEVDLAREQRRGERRRRHLDHDADRHVGGVDAARLELRPRLGEQRARRADLVHRRHEREHDRAAGRAPPRAAARAAAS